VVKPQGRRRLVSFFQEAFGFSRRRACGLAQISRSTIEYRSRRPDDRSLRERILAWARERTRYGYRRIYLLLRREGWAVNRKRVYRIYREEALSVRRRRRKQVAAAPRQAMPLPLRSNERWSLDFMADTLADGRTFRTLNVVDDFTREAIGIEVGRSIPGARVVRVLERLTHARGVPRALVLDNGPLFLMIFAALAKSDPAHAICIITLGCPSDTFQITDGSGNVINDVNGTPVSYTIWENTETTTPLTVQIHIGSFLSNFTGTVYLTEGPPSPTGLTQVSDSITAETVINSTGDGQDAFVSFASDVDATPLSYVDCSVNTCVAETGQVQDLTSLFHISGISLHVLVLSDAQAVPPPGIVWTNTAAATVGGANINGTFVNPDFLTEGSSNAGYGVAFDGTYVYWANPTLNAIGRAPRDRSSINQTFITGANSPSGVAVDASFVYWANAGANTIGRANLDGTGVNQSFITGASSPTGVVADGTYVYWLNSTGTIGRAKRDGTGVSQTLITGAQTPSGIAVDKHYIYWTNSATNSVGRANLDGTGVNQSFITGATSPGGIAVDSFYLYWANTTTHSIVRANLDGSSVNPSFISSGTPLGVAVLSRAVDWDGDGVPDQNDNCPYTPNANQADSGGIGSGSPADGIGDACQCGDVDNDGIVTTADKAVLSRSLAGLPPYGSVGAMPGFSKCDVNGDGLCNLADGIILSRAIAGLGPGIKQQCTAAVPH
jgi:hypothetical protein